jgi:hypothetical protein
MPRRSVKVHNVPSVVSQFNPPINIFLFVVKVYTSEVYSGAKGNVIELDIDIEIEVHRISYCFFCTAYHEI